MMDAFENQLTPEQRADPRFAFHVFLVHKAANRVSGADLVVELIPPGSEIYLPSEIVMIMKSEGGDRFTMDSHTKLWKRLAAKDPAKAQRAVALGKQWRWYEIWLNRVRQECEQHSDQYRTGPLAET